MARQSKNELIIHFIVILPWPNRSLICKRNPAGTHFSANSTRNGRLRWPANDLRTPSIHARIQDPRQDGPHVSPGRERSICSHLVSSTAATPPISKTSTPATKPIRPRSMPQWQAFFQSLKDDPASVTKSAQGRVVEEAGLAADRQRRTGRGARRQLGRDREGDRRQDQGQGAEEPASNSPPPMCCRRRAIRSMR